LNSTEIRRRFTDCFVERNHRPVPSSPLIPYDCLVAERLPDASTDDLRRIAGSVRDPSRLEETLRIARADALDVLTGGGKGSMG
jgi:hypothetical protein